MNSTAPRAHISVGVPAYNEVRALPTLVDRLGAVMDELDADWELVITDNRSTDGTRDYLRELTADNSRVKAVLFTRNFGHAAAHLAALEHTSGTWTVLMDADLQDEPERIPEMLELAEQGHDVVYAIRAHRREGWFMRLATSAFYRTVGRISEVPQPRQAGPFCVMSRRVVEEITALPERNVFFPGLRAYVGFRQVGLPIDRPLRTDGKPRLRLRQRIVHGLDGVFAFSNQPLRIALWLGLAIAGVAAVSEFFFLYFKLFTDLDVQGFTALMTVLLFLGGVQLLTLGVIGEYLGRVYNEVKRRPRHIVDERLGFDTTDHVPASSSDHSAATPAGSTTLANGS